MAKILILGGTVEARQLADMLAGDERFELIFSLAGRTSNPLVPKCEVRSGGFGGADGLADFLEDKGVDILVDATHSFADRITQNAATASAATGTPCLRLERKAWVREAGDDWAFVASVEEAAQHLPKGARALVTVGRQEIEPFFDRLDIKIIARMIEPPEKKPLAPHKVLRNRPPYELQDERMLMRIEHISHLVSKNSGSEATAAKLQAARELQIPVIMIARPDAPRLPTAHTAQAMARLIEETI
ncbi:MAG: cobalt-precorrin-6A reductase [Hyphomicrobiales bacterium]